MNLDDINITELIPQKPPFVFVSKLIKVEEGCAVSLLNIDKNTIFTENGYFQEPGLIENIAQTAAAMNGYFALLKNEKVKLGYIGSVKNLKINQLPKVDSSVQTTVKLEHSVMNVDIIKGIINQNNDIIAECEMRVFF
jgi:3-hydroxyacyl-[acyl-carrier-protein] dehydratase